MSDLSSSTTERLPSGYVEVTGSSGTRIRIVGLTLALQFCPALVFAQSAGLVPSGPGAVEQVQAQDLAEEGGSGLGLVAMDATRNVTRTASEWLTLTMEFLQKQGLQLAVNLSAALLVFFIGRWVSRMVTRMATVMLHRAGVDETLVRFLGNVISSLLLIVVVMASAKMLGIDLAAVTAILAAAGFAVGMALQGSLSNFAAGIMLIALKPFKVGDSIGAGSVSGTVEEINIFHTIIRTGENIRQIVPNGQITGSTISNFTAESRRKISLKVTCGYGDDLREVKLFLESLLQTEPRILQDPGPSVSVENLAEFAVELGISAWVRTKDHGAVKSTLLEQIKLGFDEQGFTIPFPSRDVYMHAAA